MNAPTPRIWLLLAISTLIPQSVFGQSSGVRPGDEIWLISARDVDRCGNVNGLQCQRFACGVWNISCCQDLFDVDQTRPMCSPVVYVHGYQTDLFDAQKRGIQVYQNLFGQCGGDDRPIRFIIWAWKSERESRRIVREFTQKAQHASQLGNAFAMTLNHLQSRPPTVIAYSLGAQVSIAALVQSNTYAGEPVQLAVIAAATDCGFSQCCLQMQNCGNIARSYVFSNRGDVAIKAARLSCRVVSGRKPEKFEQVAHCFPGQLGEVNIIDITPLSTRQHSIVRYTSIPVVIRYINELVSRACDCQVPAAESSIGRSIIDHPRCRSAKWECPQDVCITR